MKTLTAWLLMGLTVVTVSGFRAFPALSEPDPRAVYQDFQSELTSADDFDGLMRFLSSRKRNDIQRKLGLTGPDAPSPEELLERAQDNFVLRNAELVHQEIEKNNAILIYAGKVNLNGDAIVPVTLGVVMIKEDGTWRIDKQKLTFKVWTTKYGQPYQESGKLLF